MVNPITVPAGKIFVVGNITGYHPYPPNLKSPWMVLISLHLQRGLILQELFWYPAGVICKYQ